MDKLRSFLCFGLLIVLLNMQPPAFDSDHEMPISIDINYQAETIPAVQKNLPRDLPWPPFKGDSPYRRVIVELESEPTSLKRVSLQHSGFGERELGSRITDHYLELFTEHELFKSRLRLLTAEHEVLWDYYNAYNGLEIGSAPGCQVGQPRYEGPGRAFGFG